jgi:endogenous inhibitor of DNA gyrase (YacG/DUF329 family)
MKEKKLFIVCPECRKKLDASKTEYKPFCSRLCKIKDLAKWSDGSYSLAGEPTVLITEDDE